MTKILGIIPARMASTRLPGKPLADIMGKPMIQRVYERAVRAKSPDAVYVATDHPDIAAAVEKFGGKCLMTSENHVNGTSRCLEALEILQKQEIFYTHLINIQGDEPQIDPAVIDLVAATLQDPSVPIATLARKIETGEEYHSPNTVKIITDHYHNALYFSRSPIPYLRDASFSDVAASGMLLSHIGIYGFTAEAIRRISKLSPAFPETAESLEQLRWLFHGISIRVAITSHRSVSVDTPSDLELLRKTWTELPD